MSTLQLQEIVADGGGEWVALKSRGEAPGPHDLVLFRDPLTGMTCSLYRAACQHPDDVRAAIRRCHERLKSTQR